MDKLNWFSLASKSVEAVRAMIERNIKIISRNQSKKVWKILDWDKWYFNNISLEYRRNSYVKNSKRRKTMSKSKEKTSKWYWWVWAGSILLASFLAYKWFEEKDVTIYIDGFEWSRNISIDSVQRLSKSDWAENVEESIYKTDIFYNFLETNRYYRKTRRRHNHNSDSCYIKREAETYVDPEKLTMKTKYYNAEYCEYVDFQVNDWNHYKNLTTSSKNKDNPAPYWYDFKPVWNNYDLWSEREGGRIEKYKISINYQNWEKTEELNIPKGIWDALDITSECNAKASFILWVNVDTIDLEECFWNKK